MEERVVAIDYGYKRIGVAFSDPSKLIATPWKRVQAGTTLGSTAELLAVELKAIEREKACRISTVVLGFPLLMSGKQGAMADEAKELSLILQSIVSVPVILWDERLTSVQAERSMIEEGMRRKKRSKHVDTVAATIILQNYLDAQNLRLDV